MVLRLSRIAWYNTRILLNWNLACGFAVIGLAPFIFSFNLLNYKELAKIAELYFSIMGIILFAYIGNIENQEQAMELVNVRELPYWTVLIIRKMLIMVFALIMVAVMLLYAEFRGAVFPFWELVLGTMITLLFLGSIAYTFANIFNQVSSGYLVAFGYYLMEYTTKGKYTRDFYLFSLLKLDFTPKYYLLAAAIVIFAVNLIYMSQFKSKLNCTRE